MMAAVVDLLTKEAVVGLAGVVHLNITNMLEKKMNRSFLVRPIKIGFMNDK